MILETTTYRLSKPQKIGLDSIRKTITDTLDTLKAASQTQSYVAAGLQNDTVTSGSAGCTQFGLGFGIQTAGGVNINNVAITSTMALVAPAI